MSTGGFLLRFFGGMAVGLMAVAFVIGCSSSTHRAAVKRSGVLGAGVSSGAWASRAELFWLRKLGAWDTHLMLGLESASQMESAPRVERKLLARDGRTMFSHSQALQAAGNCSADLRSMVGPAPTQRLARALDAFRAACVHIERFHNAITLAVYQGQAFEVRQAQQEASRGSQLLMQADRMVPPGETRSLPVIGGDSAQSRIEPRFSRIASDLAGKDVEVRCWSHADWTRLLKEEKAYTMHRIDANTLGFATIYGNRDNLAADVCDSLVSLAYHHSLPTDPAAKLLLATAVVTLSHEPQHSKGVAVEAQAECYAIQLSKRSAIRLGAPAAYAATLQAVYWQHYDEELPAYRSPQCSNDGAYDLHKNSPVFP